VTTIFIVEDDEDIRASLADLLEGEGYVVATACNGREALDKLRAEGARPNLIILDLRMPVMDGYEFSAEKARDEALRDIPVVIMSAERQIEESRAKTGAQATLKKPASIETILGVVAQNCR
jgi:CheY-like chemotaxis protein